MVPVDFQRRRNQLDSLSNATSPSQTNVHEDFMNIDSFLLLPRDWCRLGWGCPDNSDTWVLSKTNG